MSKYPIIPSMDHGKHAVEKPDVPKPEEATEENLQERLNDILGNDE